MSGTEYAVRTVDLWKVYEQEPAPVQAIRGVTLEIAKGEFVALAGPSGSGKSTLLNLLGGLTRPTRGEVWIAGRNMTELSERELSRLRLEQIGFVFQAYNLLPTLTARENIQLPQLLAGHRPDKAWFDSVVGRFQLENRLRHRPSELSGGQQQRVAVARTLVARPEVIFADDNGQVLARRWCWRQSASSAARDDTQGAIITVEAHHTGGRAAVAAALDDLRALLTAATPTATLLAGLLDATTPALTG